MATSAPLLAAAGLQVFERGWLSANNVLFAGADDSETVLVDTGYVSHAELTLALVRHALGPRPLDRIVNTHLHSDHCGANRALQSAYGCAIDVPSGEADKVDRWDDAALTFQATGQRCPRFRRTGVVTAGSTLRAGPRRWQVLASPGHDPQSCMFYQPDLEILISADALWENGFGVVFPEIEGESAFQDVRDTLDMIARLPVRLVIPGHGSPFTDVAGALDRSHRRLSAFVENPQRHARHAAKVLIKFHLLEVHQLERAALGAWMHRTPYLALCHARHFQAVPFAAWCEQLLQELSAAKAIAIRGGLIVDL